MPPLHAVSGEALYTRKSFAWTKPEVDAIPQKPRAPELPSSCPSCGNIFPPHATFCGRCGALREADPIQTPPEVAAIEAPLDQPGFVTWRYSPPEDRPVAIRREPGPGSLKTTELLRPGEVFAVAEERPAADGVLYLKLADGRGWVMEGVAGVGAICVREEAVVAAEIPPVPAESNLHVGAAVRTVGLQSRAELNGKDGLLKAFDSAKGRWKVSFKDGTGAKLLKAENLELQQAERPQDALDVSKTQVELTPEALRIAVCICGADLLPHATFCGRCGTLRNMLPDLLPKETKQHEVAPQKVETTEEFYRRVEDMLTSGELEWEDW